MLGASRKIPQPGLPSDVEAASLRTFVGELMTDVPGDLAAFLLEAKRRTYAGLDDDATIAAPLLAGSKQLEHRAPPYAYRDNYFGMGFFVGQETVLRDDTPIWSMSYSGGAQEELTDRTTLLAIYKFLRRALLAAEID